jgi:hypothetical protein
MTIEQLLDLPTDELGKLTTGPELDRVLQPYLPFTRPATARATQVIKVSGASDALARALAGEYTDPSAETNKPKIKLSL